MASPRAECATPARPPVADMRPIRATSRTRTHGRIIGLLLGRDQLDKTGSQERYETHSPHGDKHTTLVTDAFVEPTPASSTLPASKAKARSRRRQRPLSVGGRRMEQKLRVAAAHRSWCLPGVGRSVTSCARSRQSRLAASARAALDRPRTVRAPSRARLLQR